MKSIKILMGLTLLAMVVAVTAFTGNVVAGFVAASVAGSAVQYISGTTLVPDGFAFCSPLVGLKRKCQTPTMGGAKRLYLALTEDILNEFLTYELAKTVGEFAAEIPMVEGKKWIEVEAWYDTTKFETEMKIGAGFTQSIEFKVIGYDKDIVKLIALLYEAPVNVIVQGNDDKLYYIGQKYTPMIFESKGIMPEKGTARKEATFSAKQEGLQVPVFPLAATATFDVAPLIAA
jgi:hypothetical protein